MTNYIQIFFFQVMKIPCYHKKVSVNWMIKLENTSLAMLLHLFVGTFKLMKLHNESNGNILNAEKKHRSYCICQHIDKTFIN